MQRSVVRANITGEAVLVALQGALAKARAEGHRVVVAVCDAAGLLVGFVAEEGAARISHAVARDKAFTAAMTGRSTLEWKAYLDGIPEHERRIIDAHGGYLGADGGFPIRDGEHLIGGIGVSGASQAVDAACARAGLAALDAAG